MLKKCCRCEKSKPISDYWNRKQAKDGLYCLCKPCANEEYREKRKRNPVCYIKRDRKYYQKHRDKLLRQRRKNYKRDFKKHRAHSIVKNALYYGRMIRKNCEECGNAKSNAHHDNYNKPLDVRWLCSSCHAIWHRDNKAIV